MEFQASAHRTRRRILDRNLLTLFGDLVNAVGDICDVELQVDPAGFCIPHCHAGRKVSSEVLRQTGTVFHDCAAAIAHCRSSPETSPLIVVEELRRSGVGLIKRRDDALARIERLVSDKPAGVRAIEVSARQSVLEPASNAQLLELLHVDYKFKPMRSRAMEIDGDKNARDADLMILEGIVAGMQVSIDLEADARVQLLR